MTIFDFIFKNRPLQTSQTGAQWYSNASPLVFPGWRLKVFAKCDENRFRINSKIEAKLSSFHWNW
jgi:hypothetical protein